MLGVTSFSSERTTKLSFYTIIIFVTKVRLAIILTTFVVQSCHLRVKSKWIFNSTVKRVNLGVFLESLPPFDNLSN